MASVEEENEYRAGEDDSEASSEFHGPDDPLLVAIKKQVESNEQQDPIPRSAIGAASLFQASKSSVKKNILKKGNLKGEWELTA